MNSSDKTGGDSKKYTMARACLKYTVALAIVCGATTAVVGVWGGKEMASALTAVGIWGAAAFGCVGAVISAYQWKQGSVDQAAVERQVPPA